MNRDDRIYTTLTQALNPAFIKLENHSHFHAGHNQRAAGAGDTHYYLEISSPHFVGKSRVAQHQLIHALLKSEFQTGLHSLEIKIVTTSQ